MKQIVLTLLATTFAFTASAQDYQQPNKAEAIHAVEQSSGASFLWEVPSIDGNSNRWVFSPGKYHGIPVVIDLTAFPNAEQVLAAEVAANAEAHAVYNWLNAGQPVKEDPKDSALNGYSAKDEKYHGNRIIVLRGPDGKIVKLFNPDGTVYKP